MYSFFDYPSQTEYQQPQELVFLSSWDDSKWTTLVRYAETLRFKVGDQVIRLGDTDRAFYIIIEGRLEVLIPYRHGRKARRTQVRESGAVIGEQAFLDGKPRSATIAALTDGSLLRISVEMFEVFAAHHPDLARDVLFDLARLLSIKLRQANAIISQWIK